MLATEILKGQGIGNQLFCYITVRSLSYDRGLEFGIKDLSGWAGSYTDLVNDYNSNGFYWFDLEMGAIVPNQMNVYYEKDVRIKMPTCQHDMTHGCDVRGFDEGVVNAPNDTIIMGNLQDERYFLHNKSIIKEWLKVKSEFDTYEFSNDNLCILNFRGGPYVGFYELFLSREYWIKAMDNMLSLNPKIKFIIITDDVKTANQMFPEIPTYHFDVARDYSIIKNSRHVILSNSSFAYFPVFTSDTIETIIAPKYWGRHNVSDGYWASEQNLYSGWLYQDREGNLESYEDCYQQLQQYKKNLQQ